MSEKKRRPGRYPDDVRERAVRMVFDHQHEYPSQWKAIESISKKLSINHETLRIWVRRAETDAGDQPGLTTDERARMLELERENKELRCAHRLNLVNTAAFAIPSGSPTTTSSRRSAPRATRSITRTRRSSRTGSPRSTMQQPRRQSPTSSPRTLRGEPSGWASRPKLDIRRPVAHLMSDDPSRRTGVEIVRWPRPLFREISLTCAPPVVPIQRRCRGVAVRAIPSGSVLYVSRRVVGIY